MEILLLIGLAILIGMGAGKSPRRFLKYSRARPSRLIGHRLDAARTVRKLARHGGRLRRRRKRRDAYAGEIIEGTAHVIDGDSIKVSGYSIRLAGIDAPEIRQPGKHADGYWYDQGAFVKRELVRAIGGKFISVRVNGHDKYGRVVGVVSYNGADINEWLVREGFAIAAYGDEYKWAERKAMSEERGIWADQTTYRPSSWRKR